MTYHSFEGSGTQTATPPAGVGVPPYVSPTFAPPSSNSGSKSNWAMIAATAAMVVAVAVAALVILRPGASPRPIPANTVNHVVRPTPPPPPPPPSSTQQFLNDVNGQGADFASVPDSQLLGYGNAACSDFQGGNTVDQTINDALSAANNNSDGLNVRDMGVIVGAATATLCPTYGPEVQAWAQANG